MLKETLLRLNITKSWVFFRCSYHQIIHTPFANTAWSGHCVIPPTLAKPFEQTFWVSGLHKKCLFQHIVTSPPLYWGGGNLRKCNLHFVTFIVPNIFFFTLWTCLFKTSDIDKYHGTCHLHGFPRESHGDWIGCAFRQYRWEIFGQHQGCFLQGPCGNKICNQSANTAIRKAVDHSLLQFPGIFKRRSEKALLLRPKVSQWHNSCKLSQRTKVLNKWAVNDCEWLQHITKCYRCKHVTPCFSAWINERRRSMISLIFQKHPCATEMAVSNSPCILEDYVKVGDWKKICRVRVPCISWNPHSNSISALLAVDTSPQNSHQKVGTRWPSNLAILPWKFTESGLTQRKS